MDESQVRSKLKAKIANTNKDVEWAWQEYQQNYEDAKELSDSSVSGEEMQERAIRTVKTSILKGSRTSNGDFMEVEILGIGHTGFQEWGDGKDARDVLIAYGIVEPKPSDGSDMPQQLGVFQCDSNVEVDIGRIKEQFETYNTFRGWFSLSQSNSLQGVYHLEVTEETRVEPLSTNADKATLRQQVDKHFGEEDMAEIGSIAQYLSQQESDSEYAAEFGGDLKKMDVYVVDYYVSDGFNTLTVLDDSVGDESQLGSDVVSDQARSPGFTCWVPDEFMHYDSKSQLELYGSISAGRDGQISMNVCGVNPIIAYELDDSEWQDDGGNGNTEVQKI